MFVIKNITLANKKRIHLKIVYNSSKNQTTTPRREDTGDDGEGGEAEQTVKAGVGQRGKAQRTNGEELKPCSQSRDNPWED